MGEGRATLVGACVDFFGGGGGYLEILTDVYRYEVRSKKIEIHDLR